MRDSHRKTLICRLRNKVSILEQKLNSLSLDNSHSKKTTATRTEYDKYLFELIAENTSDGIMIASADATIEYVSPNYAKQLGYLESEEVGKTADDIYNTLHPDDRDMVFSKVYGAIGNKASELTYKFRARHKLGHYIWREDHAKFNYDENGNHINTYVIARDITERIHLDDQLFALQKVVNNAPLSIVITDTDANIQYANPYFSEVTGYALDELYNQNTAILRSDYHPKEYYQELWNTISAGKTWEGTFCNKKKDGTLYWERSIIVPVKNSLNEIANYIAIKTDISKERETAALLNQRQHQISAINQNIPLTSWRFKLDSDGNIVSSYVSNFINTLLDISEEKIKYNFDVYLQFVLPEYRQGLVDVIHKRFENPNINISYEYQVVTNKGEIHWLASSGFAVRENDELVCYGSTIDITERKLLEESLIKTNYRMKVATDSAGIGIWELQPKTNTLIWDDWMFKLYGFPKDEFDGTIKSWKRNVYDEDIDSALIEVQKALDEGNSLDTMFRVIHPDGSLHYLKAFGIVIRDKDGAPEYMMGVNYDITNIKNYQQELKLLNNHLESMVKSRTKQLESVLDELMLENEKKNQALDKLYEANAAKHKYISILAHDIKNPLTAILTSTELIKLFLDRDKADKLPKHVDRINESSRQILNLVDMVLMWNKSKNNAVKFEPELVTLADVLGHVVKFLDLSLEQKHINVVHNISKKVKLFVDRNMFETVVRNLLSNAIKFSHQNSSIFINLIQESDYTTIQIRDEGIGIAEDRLNTIFEPNDKNHTLGTQGEKGTGLGLPLCKEFILKHQGKIWVESEVNRGSTFYIQLPNSQKK